VNVYTMSGMMVKRGKRKEIRFSICTSFLYVVCCDVVFMDDVGDRPGMVIQCPNMVYCNHQDYTLSSFKKFQRLRTKQKKTKKEKRKTKDGEQKNRKKRRTRKRVKNPVGKATRCAVRRYLVPTNRPFDVCF
jgi:hypothetical protein